MRIREITRQPAYCIFWSWLIPLSIFGALIGLMMITHSWYLPQLPPKTEPDLPLGCPAVRIEKSEAHCNEPVETCDPRNYRTQPMYCCNPQSSKSRDWEVAIKFQVQGTTSDCDYDLLIGDNQIGSLHPTQPNYPNVRQERGKDGSLIYWLSGNPWRAFTVVPRWHRGGQAGFAGESMVLVFYQKDGLNIRRSAFIWFMIELATALLLLFGLYYFRPGGPRELDWLRYPRWRSIAAVAGCGGALSGGLFMVRPPDFGGYDQFPLDIRLIATPILLLGLLAIAGCAMDVCRRTLAAEPRSMSLLLLTPIAIFMTASTIFAYTHLARYASVNGRQNWLHFKGIYYLYYSLAVCLPLLLYHDSTWLLAIERGAGSVRPSRERWLALFAWSAFGGLFATLIAILLGDLLEVTAKGHTLVGFYKKASGIGLWLVTLPILSTLAFAVSIGEERPRWIQELDACLSKLFDSENAAVRPQLARQVLALLFQNRQHLTIAKQHLGFASEQIRPLLALLTPLDWEQLAEELSQESVRLGTELEHIAGQLETSNQPKRRSVATPLLLVKDGETLSTGEIRVSCQPDPGRRASTAFAIYRNGYLIQPNAMLRDSVVNVVRMVEVELVGPRSDGRLPFEGQRCEIHFHYPDVDAEGFSGHSYELPLALSTWLLATGRAPQCRSWRATGGIDVMSLTVKGVEGLAIKVTAMDVPGAVLIARAETLESLALLNTPHRMVRVLRDDGLADADQLAGDLKTHLNRGGVAIIGVRTLKQAIRIVAGSQA